jgi:hypothetical protein
MKLIIAAVAAIMVKTTPVLASSGQEIMGTGLLALLFLGFGSFIIVCQFIPGLALFCSMLKGLFNSAATKSVPRTDANTS